MIALIFLVSCGLLALGHRFYGCYLSRRFEIDPARPTPSRTMTDGVLFMLATTATSMVMLIRTHLSASNEGAVAPIGWINLPMLLMTLVLLVNTAVGWRWMGSVAVADDGDEPEPKVVDGAA